MFCCCVSAGWALGEFVFIKLCADSSACWLIFVLDLFVFVNKKVQFKGMFDKFGLTLHNRCSCA